MLSCPLEDNRVPLSIRQTAELIRKRQLSPVELTRHCLEKIAQLNPVLNAFITVTAESALAEARTAEAEIQRGNWRGPLHGIPIGIKDLIDTAGVATTAGSALFRDRIPAEDAEVVRRLRNAGAILLGKHNLHEFAYGGSSMISHFGEVRNPWNPAHIAGGSSGGSASAVAAGMCFAAIGTDTAGSVREPAALCGIVGLKPTYGRVSAGGVIALAPSFDHVGPLTRTVEDAAIMFRTIADSGPKHQGDSNQPAKWDDSVFLGDKLGTIRIGVPIQFFYEDLDPEVAKAVQTAISVLEQLGGTAHPVDVPVSTDRTLQSAESYAVHAANVARSPEFYQPETLRRIRTGEKVTPAEILKCRHKLQEIRSRIGSVFEGADVLLTPTVPILAPTVAELKQNPDLLRPREILLLRNTRPVNVWGLPAISVPCGFSISGLPIGLQIIAPHSWEARALQVAYAYQQATDWHAREPAPI